MASIFFAFSIGIFLYSFWFSQVLPPLSKHVIGWSLLATVILAVACYFYINQVIEPVLRNIGRKDLIMGLATTLLLSLTVMWFGFQGFAPNVGYLTFLLPDNQLKISVDGLDDSGVSDLKITWFNTSLGDISFNSLDYTGWERVGDEVVLREPFDNQITWTGKTGSDATLNFEFNSENGILTISWNGENERIDLNSENSKQVIVRKTFHVPFYASPWVSVVFGFLGSMLLVFGLYCIFWKSKDDVEEYLSAIKRQIEPNNERKIDYFLLFLFIILAFALRVVNLDALYPIADEYSHLLAAKNILAGSSIHSVYSRSLFDVTLPVVFFLKILGQNLWAARLAGVVFNTLALIPLFIICRKFNRLFAVVALTVYSTSPWIISVARTVREYGYYPFYFYWVLLLLLVYWEKFPNKFVFKDDWKLLLKPFSLLTYGISVLILVYAKFIDPSSTFRTILPTFLIIGIFLLIKIDWKSRSNIFFALIAGSIVLITFSLFFKRLPSSQNFILNISVIKELFAQNSPVNWFYDRTNVIAGLSIFAAFLLAIKLRKSTKLPFIFISLFFISVVLFSLTLNHYIRPRYFFNLQIWFVLLFSFGLYALLVYGRILLGLIFSRFEKKSSVVELLASIAPICFILVFVNYGQIILPSQYSQNGFMPITTEYHYDLGPVNDVVLSQYKQGDVLISSIYGSYARWVGEPMFKEYFYFNYTMKNQDEYIYSIIDKYPHGWIVLDKWNAEVYSEPLKFGNFNVGMKQVNYLGIYIDEYVWNW